MLGDINRQASDLPDLNMLQQVVLWIINNIILAPSILFFTRFGTSEVPDR